MPKITNEEILFDNRYKIQEANITDGNLTFKRMRLLTRDAACVLVFNSETKKIILTRQFRYAVSSKVTEEILEIVAGTIDDGESALNAGIRETEEEIGYKVKPNKIKAIGECFASPGYSSEKLNIFFATVLLSDRTTKGGGLENEDEKIEIVEIDVTEFIQLVKSGKIIDSKSLIAGLWFVNNVPL